MIVENLCEPVVIRLSLHERRIANAPDETVHAVELFVFLGKLVRCIARLEIELIELGFSLGLFALVLGNYSVELLRYNRVVTVLWRERSNTQSQRPRDLA
jgi:hypothetical protein